MTTFIDTVSAFLPRPPLVTVLRLGGVIGQVGPLRAGLTGEALGSAIERAFAPKRLAAVALAINSPGGSPVQSQLIYARIRRWADQTKVPVLAFAEDVAASGGYWLAMAADEVYADENSIIGSIGVISAGFGFPEAIRRLGVERRLYTAGENKSLLDSFSAERPEDVARLRAIQGDIHDSFKALVRRRRAGRLQGDEASLFSGEFWTGRRALELGLIDGLGDLGGVVRSRFGEKVRIRTIRAGARGWRRRLGLVDAPPSWAGELIGAVEERQSWSRFGL